MFKRIKRKMKIKKNIELTEDELIEQELDEEVPDVSVFNIKDFIDLMKSKSPEDIEWEELMTEQDKLEEKESNKEIKRLVLIGSSILASIFICLFVVGIFVKEYSKSDLYKVTEPLLIDYYKEKYNKKIKFETIKDICNIKDEECSNRILATTKDGIHVMTVNNELIGDDTNTKLFKELDEYIKNSLISTNITSIDTIYSYQDYYDNYLLNLPQIKVIPNMKIEELLSTTKLTVNLRVTYINDLNESELLSIVNNFSNDSEFYFLKLDNGIPTKLSVFKDNRLINLDIIGKKNIEEGIVNYDFNRSQNAANLLKLTRFSDSEISEDNYKNNYKDYTLKNIMQITFEIDNIRGENPPSYYLLQFDKGKFSANNLEQLSHEYNKYNLVRENEYQNIIIINFAGKTYLIGEKPIIIGNLEKNKSFLCNFGLC